MMYPLVLELAADGVPVTVTCRVLGFFTQAFYKWRKAPLTQRDWDDAHLIDAALAIHADDPAFGYRFIADELPASAIVAVEDKVARLCSQERIWSIFAKKRGLNRKSGPPGHDDFVARQFSPEAANQVWLPDITEHRQSLLAISRSSPPLQYAIVAIILVTKGHRPGEGAMPDPDDRFADDSLDEITDALLTASRLLVAISSLSIASVDETLTIPQFRTMVILSTRGPIDLATLAGLLDVAPSTTGRMADRLVGAGLIDRHPPPDSRRELVVELTARGREVVADVTGHRRRKIAEIVEIMPGRERHGLVRAPDRARARTRSRFGDQRIPCLTT